MAKKEETQASTTPIAPSTEEMSVEERRQLNRAAYIKYLDEKVPICIPLGGEKIGTTTTASCDGKVYEIKLGETVKVPRRVAQVINRSIDANVEVQKKMEKMSAGAVELGEY